MTRGELDFLEYKHNILNKVQDPSTTHTGGKMNYLLTGDWHIREDVPRCRMETPAEWLLLQLNSIQYLIDLAREKQATILVNGDVFHRAETSPHIVNVVIKLLLSYKDIYITHGNHDLLQRDSQLEVTSYGTLLEAGIKTIGSIHAFVPYGTEIVAGKQYGDGPLFLHQLVFPTKDSMPPGDHDGITAGQLLNKYTSHDVLVTSDNHTSFTYTEKGGIVINPGCLTRQSVKFKDSVPGFYMVMDGLWFDPIWYDNPHDLLPELISDKHIRQAKEKDERTKAYIESVQNIEDISLDYVQTATQELPKSSLSARAKQFVEQLLRGKK